MTATRVLGLGAGGHAKVVLDALEVGGGYDIVGLLDPREDLIGTVVHGVTVLGNDDLLGPQYDSGMRHVFIGLGGAAGTRPRRRLYDAAVGHGYVVVTAIHPQSVVS